MNKYLNLLLASCLLLGACSTPERLEPYDGTVPPGTDLSGNWVMREMSRADRRRVREAIDKTDGVDGRQRATRSSSRGGSGSVKGGLVHVFLETGSALKVTQTAHGLFISFDRSVVEEFRFGEHRLVSVGAVEAERVTGWDGTQLVVETLGKNRMKLTDRFYLVDGGDTLRREITLRSKKLEEETVVQEFDRVE
jgi:hypothetical protein